MAGWLSDPSPSQQERAEDVELARDYHRARLDLAERELVPRIANGDMEARRQLLSIVAEAILECGHFPGGVAAFMARGLERIAQDIGDLDAPFGIRLKKGQRRRFVARQNAAQEFRRAYRIEYLRGGFEGARGLTVEKAIAQLAGEDGIPEDTARRAWRKRHKVAKREIEYQMKFLGRVLKIK